MRDWLLWADEETDAPLPGKATKLQTHENRTKTDTGGRVENTKALERTRMKELGKLAP